MSANVFIAVATRRVPLGAGVVAGVFRYTITGPITVVQQSNEIASMFHDVPPGDYHAAAERLDGEGNVLGQVSGGFTVPPETQFADVPATITVVLG